MTDTDLKILSVRKENLLTWIGLYKNKLSELEGELECINSYISNSK